VEEGFSDRRDRQRWRAVGDRRAGARWGRRLGSRGGASHPGQARSTAGTAVPHHGAVLDTRAYLPRWKKLRRSIPSSCWEDLFSCRAK